MNYDNNYIESYIIKIFDFYNGIINAYVPAVLRIEWADLRSSSNGGTTSNPNIVTIYPSVIKRFAKNDYQYFYLILETIIHELFHIDQIIDYVRMTYDNQYVKYIEYAVETQTALYISNHKNEICQEFGLDIRSDLNYYRGLIEYYSMGYTYHRKNYATHLICVLKEILEYSGVFDHEYLFNFIEQIIDNALGSITVIINDSKLVITKNGFNTNLSVVNNFFYDNYFYGEYREYSTAMYDLYHDKESDSTDIVIEIKASIKNIMCKTYAGHNMISI